jgi:hypothetical protein
VELIPFSRSSDFGGVRAVLVQCILGVDWLSQPVMFVQGALGIVKTQLECREQSEIMREADRWFMIHTSLFGEHGSYSAWLMLSVVTR